MRPIAELRAEYGADLLTVEEARAEGLRVPLTVSDGLQLVVDFLSSRHARHALDRYAREAGGVYLVDETWPDDAQRAALVEAVALLRGVLPHFDELLAARQAIGRPLRLDGPHGATQWTRLECERARVTCPTVESVIDRKREKPTLSLAERPGLERVLLEALRGLLEG